MAASDPREAGLAWRHPRTAAAVLRLASLAILLADVGCAPQSDRSALLEQSYRDIQEGYVEPMPAKTQALATMRELSKIDHDVTIAAVDNRLVLRHGALALQSFPAPAATDWQGWGETAAEATAAAALASPAIAALPSDTLDAGLINAAVSVLDQYSRYIPPDDVPDPLLVEGSQSDQPAHESFTPAKTVGAPPASQDPGASVRLRIRDDIATVVIERFTSRSGELLGRLLTSAMVRGATPRGMILDLRNNLGGNIAGAIDLAGLFLPPGTPVFLEAQKSARTRIIRTELRPGATTMPLVVLINGRTASAAEIVAAALQDNGRALVVGSPSFGKGAIQQIFDLANGGELWVTTAYSRAPSGYFLQRHGVVPDVCASLHDAPADAVKAHRYRTLLARRRLSLREEEWAELRGLCPPTVFSGDDPVSRLATRLLRRGS